MDRRSSARRIARSRSLAQRNAAASTIAQGIEIFGIVMTASDRKHVDTKDTKDAIKAMNNPARSTRIGNANYNR